MNRYSPQYGNFELALQPVPPPAPPPGGPKHDVHIEGEKTEQKAVQRQGSFSLPLLKDHTHQFVATQLNTQKSALLTCLWTPSCI